jgi:UDP-2,3-diacylglucosamine pyrophosphatase LpxH
MPPFDQVIAQFAQLLGRNKLALQATDVRVVFTSPVIDTPIFAIPDVHLCKGDAGDIFLNGTPEKATALAGTLRAVHDYLQMHPQSRAIQLGDWFDIWRVCGEDSMSMAFGAIENAAAFAEILDYDARIGLAHVVGNHDAAFLNAVPNRRAAQSNLFRLGFWLGHNVYALHGHQTSIAPPANQRFDEVIVHLANVLGSFIPGVTKIQEFIDKQQVVDEVKLWIRDLITGSHEDTGPHLRPRDRSNLPASVKAGNFVVREDLDALASIIHQVEQLPGAQGRVADLLLVGHSHVPCASWSDVGGRPLVLVDAGAWVYAQSNIAIAAGDTVAVFDVV